MRKVPLYSLLIAAGLAGIQPLAAQTQTTAATTTLSPEAQIAAAQANYDAWDKPSQPIGPNHRTTVRTAKTGPRQIVEIGTGMNFWNGLQWVPSNPTFVPVANGFLAGQLQDPVQLAGDLYTTNAVTVRTPEGIVLGSSPVAVALYDAASGNFAVIATITNCQATLVESNQVLYPDAFSGNVCASVVYTISQGTFHQDVVFTGPLDPADYGFPRDTTRIQIITEFYGAPDPDELDRPLYVEADAKVRARMVSPDLIDQQLGFGRFVLTTGKAYVTSSQDTPNGLETLVAKEYKTVGDGTYLFESIPYNSIAAALSNLPPCHPSFGSMKFKSTKGYANIPHPGNKPHANPMMARASHAPVHGVVVDYVANIGGTMSGVTIFQGDTTFLVSSAVSCNGPTTVEGGSVFKYKPGVSITLNSTLTCKTGQYRPAIFTAVDDDAVGDSMTNVVNSGYTGTISSSGYANPALYTQNAMNFSGFRIRYAQEAIRVFGSSTWSVSHAQFVNCIKGIEIQGSGGSGCGCSVGYFNVNNCLFSRVPQPILGTSVGGNVSQYVSLFNATVDQASALGTLTSCGVNLYVQSTNSIYASVSSNGANVSPNGTENAFYSDGNTFGSSQISLPSSPFLSFGAGNYYLTNLLGIQTSGITNGLPATLLKDFAKRTTYPPWVIARTTLSTNLTLVPQARRDTNVASLGYHYDPIDYAFGNVYVSNASVTASGGVAIATFGTNNSAYGLGFGVGSSLSSIGAPNVPDWIVLFNTVQEGTNLNWQRLTNSVTGELFGATPAPSIYTRFTSWSVLAQDAAQFYAPTNTGPIGFQDSEFHGGKLLSYRPTINLTNCLLERVYASLVTSDGNSPYIRNNLFYGGIFKYAPNVTNSFVKDNLFDQTVISNNSSVYTTYNGGYNAFVTNNSRLLPANANDLIIMTNAPHYQAGPLGFYYQTNTSVLINAGHTNADQVGLYEYTVCTNLVGGLEIKETNSVVDIGYHYVATDAYGNPIDTYLSGTPDYLVDTAGNGMDTNGLPFWWELLNFGQTGVDPNADPDYDGICNLQEYLSGTDPNDPYSGQAIMLGYWRFNSPSLTNEVGQGPTAPLGGITTLPDWSGTSVYLPPGYDQLKYPEYAPNGNANISCRNGTIRFWFKPHWTSGSPADPNSRLLDFGTDNGDHWGMGIGALSNADAIDFYSQSNGVSEEYFAVPFQFTSNVWCQLTLTYTPTNIAFYTNGLLAATCIDNGSQGLPSAPPWYGNDFGAGVYNYPPETVRSNGFSIGCSDTHRTIDAEFDELQTYNYALTAKQVAQGFPGFNGAANVMQDSDYDGRSDLLEQYADGTDPNDPGSVLPTRLGYWRFNDSNNIGEMGQSPLSAVHVSNVPDWSRNSLVISSASDSVLTYRDVETNGWANFNCRKGAVRFWFKPNWSAGSRSGADSPFLSMGTLIPSDFWDLYATSSGDEIGFALNTPSVNNNYFQVPWSFNISNWCQIVFNYSPTNLALYVNGTLLTNVTVSGWSWPALSSRTNGLTIGNYPVPCSSINGQFDELETFNYNLDTNEIIRSFQAVKSVDSDLNGVADLLEELILTNNVPFMGVPFPVTGVFEAEQFDVGGPNVGYYALDSAYATINYRISALDITNCDDLGGGFCVDKLRAGEWLQYTMDVGVAQTYAVEARVKGIGSNGVFKIEFYTNGATLPYAWTTNNLVVPDTNWVNVTFKNLWLAAGTNVMKVTMLTNGLANGVSSGYVMKFNYTSIYSSWNEGVTNIVYTNNIPLSQLVASASDWIDASNNAVTIQNAIDDVAAHVTATQGGVVNIPAGTYYVASREITDEKQDQTHNTADYIYTNNVQIQGAGKTNTVLVAHNRAVTIFYAGLKFNGFVNGVGSYQQFAVTNFTLQDLTLEASPHWVYNAGAANQRIWNDGGFNPVNGDTGCLMSGQGKSTSEPLNNILVTRCLFKNSPENCIVLVGQVINFLSISNDFFFRADGTNGGAGNVALWVRAGGRPSDNLNMIACTFNGHVNPTNTDTSWPGNGLMWCQWLGGNWFAARNTITNYGLEAIQWNSGPAAAAQNSFSTYIDGNSTCALNNSVDGAATGPSGRRNDLSFSFTGNTVVGGQAGILSGQTGHPTNIVDLLISGNTFNLYWTLPVYADWPDAEAVLWWVDKLNVSGNTLMAGEQGICVQYALTNAVILGNDFTPAHLRSVDTEYFGNNVVGAIQSAQLIKNKLAGGDSFQVRAPLQDGTHYFLLQNTYVTTNGAAASLVTEPQSLPIHYQP